MILRQSEKMKIQLTKKILQRQTFRLKGLGLVQQLKTNEK